ncbi:MAG: Tm-1-like ATP-binding domain-containing protein [Kibdelosporangium sp.]
MARVVLAGALDTKGAEYAFVADHLRQSGVDVLLADVGTRGGPTVEPDIPRTEILAAAGAAEPSRSRADALAHMADGLRTVLTRLADEGRIDAVLGFGGSGAVALLAPAFRALPLGLPKIIVSTMAAFDTQAVIGASDLLLMPSVVDIAGLNSFTRGVLTRAAGLVLAGIDRPVPAAGGAPLVAASMFGVTTVGVDAARRVLEEKGFDVLVFHANGVGGRTLESLARQGILAGVLDLTTTELADEMLGGKASAGPDRLRAAGSRGIPQVVSVGALDIANFGAPDTLPSSFDDRVTYQHGPMDTLLRTSVPESTRLGEILAARLSEADGPVRVLLPSGGVSALSEQGGAFWDPAAEEALVDALLAGLPTTVQVERTASPLNSVEFGQRAGELMAGMIGGGRIVI